MSAKMTRELWLIGARNAFFVMCFIGAVIGGGTLAISVLGKQSVWAAFAITFGLLWTASMIVSIYCWVVGKFGAGPVVIDCGPVAGRTVYLINAGLFSLFGLFHRGIVGDLPYSSGYLFCFTAVALYLFMAFSRVQFRENGVWQSGYLLRWQKIKSYTWSGQADGVLKLQVRTRFPFLGRGALIVPDSMKEACCRLLDEQGIARS